MAAAELRAHPDVTADTIQDISWTQLAMGTYHPTTWERLRAIKRTWDPDNRFSANQNIAPSGQDTA